MTIKIYFFGPMDRSGRVRWLLEEMGMPYEDHRLDYQKQEHKSESYLKINPLGAVPAIEENGETLTESGGICAYLTDKHRDKEMSPNIDSPLRGKYMQWMFMIPATIEPYLVECFRASQLPEEERSKVMVESATKFEPVLKMIADKLGDNEYMIGNKFSAVDIMLASTLHWAKNFELLQNKPTLDSYIERLKSREAAVKVGAFLPITPPKEE